MRPAEPTGGNIVQNNTCTAGNKLPIGLKLAAIYLLITGLFGFLLFIFPFRPEYSEFVSKSIAYKAGAYFRITTFNILSVVSGVGIILRKSWARKLALIFLVISVPYSANEFAWGFFQGNPTKQIYIISLVAIIIWNSIWFLLIFKKTSRDALIQKNYLQENKNIKLPPH